jgi:hypothetical protein
MPVDPTITDAILKSLFQGDLSKDPISEREKTQKHPKDLKEQQRVQQQIQRQRAELDREDEENER